MAASLINLEPDVRHQVPLLMSLEKYALALEKAVDGGDSEMTIAVLSFIHRKTSLTSFVDMSRTRLAVWSLYRSFLPVSRDELKRAHECANDIYGLACIHLEDSLEAHNECNHQLFLQRIASAGKLFDACKSSSKSALPMSRSCLELSILHKMQVRAGPPYHLTSRR